MPFLKGKRIPTLFAALLLFCFCLLAQQKGTVVDRNGAPQPRCQIEFYVAMNQPPAYRAISNRDGVFVLSGAKPGPYIVVIQSGPKKSTVRATVTEQGISPSRLPVPW